MGTALGPIVWLGRQGTRAVALSLFLGMALPPVSAFAKPALPVAVFLLLVLAMIRLDMVALRIVGGQPLRLAAMVVWCMVAVPAIGGIMVSIAHQQLGFSGDIRLAITLMLVAPPIMSVPAFCYLLGLNGALSFVVMVLTLIVTPITAPLIANTLVEGALPLSTAALALRLAFYLFGSAAVALALRRLLGAETVAAQGDLIDGLNVILLFVFAVALMDGVAALTFARPGLVAMLIAVSFGVAGTILAVTTVVFSPLGAHNALSLGLAAGNRNMGLMASALIAGLPDLTWAYVALAQFPIYLLPWIMRPIVGWLGANQAPHPHR